jgi:sulfatase modifying factor 1
VGAGSGNNDPVTTVNWYEALKWCKARSEMEGLNPVYRVGGVVYRSGESVPTVDAGNGYRLSTEAEWEYAARGGALTHGYLYSGSNDANAVAWYSGNSGGVTHGVGTKLGNELGIFDMSGNVWEWCFDGQGGYTGADRVYRGGGWNDHVQITFRNSYAPAYSYGNLGFRVVRSFGP